MSTFNPDYPSAPSTGFLQYTYQPEAQLDSRYYPGSLNPYNIDPYGFNAYGYNGQPDSRRNIGGNNAMNPVNPFAQFGQTQSPTSIPETAVQPYSSYPPATPNGQQAMGLNAMIDSRRNVTSTPATSTNPWAQQQQNAFQAPTIPSVPSPVNTIPGGNQTSGWFDYGCTPGYKIDTNMLALYGNNPYGFDRHQSWENYYTQERKLPMPTIDWRAISEAQAPYNNRPAMPQYPVQQWPTAQVNWRESAEQIWSSPSL